MNERDWATAIIQYCLIHGVDHFFVAPGSRCTPLTLAIARQRDTTIVQHFDERGLAFAALGYGLSSGKPGVFVCTSGTAVGNALPAVIEASVQNVPLLLFTADRPDELRGTGANQTIEQREIFGGYPRLFLNMPVPKDVESGAGAAVLEESLKKGFTAARCGPVHLNWMFREPFQIGDPLEQVASQPIAITDKSTIGEACESEGVRVEVQGNTVIMLGRCSQNESEQAQALAEQLNCPLVADVTSGLRTMSLELPTEFSLPEPDTILHLGGRFVSKSWLQWTKDLNDSKTTFIHLTATGETINPGRIHQTKYQTALLHLTSKVTGSQTDDEFLATWQRASVLRNEAIGRVLHETSVLSEPAIAFEVGGDHFEALPLFVGNSMPIRDMDWYSNRRKECYRNVFANRGASGIDGLIATTTGVAAGLQRMTTAVVGDLSALHDLNSLSLLRNSPWPVILIVVNNQGGHIFDMLPISKSKHFERFFATPHQYQFQHAAQMFELSYKQTGNIAEFREIYGQAIGKQESTIIELITDRGVNIKVRQQIRAEIEQCRTEV